MRDALSLRQRSDWEDGATLARGGTHRVTWIDHQVADAFQRWLRPADLRLELWDGSSPWNSTAASLGDVVVRDRGALWKLVIDPDLQFGELYTEGRVQIRGGLRRVMEASGRLPGRDRLSIREWLALRYLAPMDFGSPAGTCSTTTTWATTSISYGWTENWSTRARSLRRLSRPSKTPRSPSSISCAGSCSCARATRWSRRAAGGGRLRCTWRGTMGHTSKHSTSRTSRSGLPASARWRRV